MIIWRPTAEVEERSKVIRRDFARRYPDQDALREQLFREQEGICAICRKPLQSTDSVICVIDHACPVFCYATWDYSIEETCAHANTRCNLLAVHIPCNAVKREWDYEEFMEQLASGAIVLDEVKMLTPEDIQRLKYEAGKGGRKNVESGQLASISSAGGRISGRIQGGIQGRKNAENKTGVCGRTPEQMREDGIKGGRIQGRKHFESKTGVCGRSPEQMREDGIKGGRTQGRKNAISGHCACIASLGGRIGGCIGGRIGGRKAVESGRLASVAAKGGPIGRHNRWHVRRGVSKPDTCELCAKSCGDQR